MRLIYHNICCVHRLRGSQGDSDGKPVKQGNKPPENPPETRRLCFTACMSMRASA